MHYCKQRAINRYGKPQLNNIDNQERSIMKTDNFNILTEKELLLAKLRNSKQPVIICGADVAGKVIWDICKKAGIEVAGFSDYKPDLTGKLFCGLRISYTPEISKEFRDAIFIISVMTIRDVVKVLRAQGIESWFAGGILLDGVDTAQTDASYLINDEKYQVESCQISHRAFLKKEHVFLRSIDVMITERCSLRCEGCSNLMQYFEHPKDYNLQELFETTDSFLQYVDEVMEARIIGGDTFMNRDWPKILEHVINSRKIKRITIYTNGIIIPDLKDIPALSHEKVIVIFTDYGKLSRNLNKIVNLFQKHKVWHRIVKLDDWLDCSSIHKHNRTDDQNNKLFRECISTSLVTLTDGKVFRCPYAASAFLLGAVEDCPTDYVDVSALAKNKIDINVGKKMLNDYIFSDKSLSICDYCTSRLLKNKIAPAVQIQKTLKYEKISIR
jgi:hypothetical protein